MDTHKIAESLPKSPGEDENKEFINELLTEYKKKGLFAGQSKSLVHIIKNLACDISANIDPKEKSRRIVFALFHERQAGFIQGKAFERDARPEEERSHPIIPDQDPSSDYDY